MRVLFVWLLVVCGSGFADTTAKINLAPVITYKDISTIYKVHDRYVFELSVSYNEKKIVAASMTSPQPFSQAPRYVFPANELTGMQLQQDDKGRIWVTKLPFSYLLANWMLFQVGGDWSNDAPSQPLKTIGPSSVTYEFSFELPLRIDPELMSNEKQFEGTRRDGRVFQAALWLRQNH